MKIGITVYIDSFSMLYTEAGNRQYWDTYGGSQAIDDDLQAFDKSQLSIPSVKPSNGFICTGITSDGYKWRTIVASFAEREALRMTKFPTIIFTDTQTGKEKGRIEGTPYPTGIIKQALQKIFAENASNGTTTAKTKKNMAFAALFLLLLFKIKKGAAVV